MDTAVGMETGVKVDVGTDLMLVMDMSGNVSMGAGAEAETGAGMSAMVVGSETVPPVCVVAGVQHVTAEQWKQRYGNGSICVYGGK